MLPIGQLMIEHRLIERIITQIKNIIMKAQASKSIDINIISQITDFIRNYADKCHHGKEEDILFKDLNKKKISQEHKKIIEELIRDHVYGRELLFNLTGAANDYMNGHTVSFEKIIESLKNIIKFYPEHIKKEEKSFFMSCMKYYSDIEKQEMLTKFNEFDKSLFHSVNKTLVEKIEYQIGEIL